MYKNVITIENDELNSLSENIISLVFQGYIMSKIPEEIAQNLHNLSVNPYSIYVHKNKNSNQVELVVNSLNDEFNRIIEPILKSESIFFKKINSEVKVLNIEEFELNEKDLSKILYEDNDLGKKLKIRFESPTSFKQNDENVIFPTPRLIFQSLIMKYANLIENRSEIDVDMLSYIEKNVHISSYNLRTNYYQIHDQKIPAFLGSITLVVRGATTLVQYLKMLILFGEYSGVGVKTSMGMGTIKLLGDKNER
jgi:CRISPR-associated endoribonuclease Cas6